MKSAIEKRDGYRLGLDSAARNITLAVYRVSYLASRIVEDLLILYFYRFAGRRTSIENKFGRIHT